MAMEQWDSRMDDSSAKAQQRKGKKNHQKEDTGKVKTTEKLVGDGRKKIIAPIMKLLRWHPTENIQEEATIGGNNDNYQDGSDALKSMKPSTSFADKRLTNEKKPCIKDLSDENRPTKFSERYLELYDNHWTDAFQNLQDKHHMSETAAIEFLLDVLYVSFDQCKKARLQRERAIQALNEYIGADGNVKETMRKPKSPGWYSGALPVKMGFLDDPQDLTVLEVMETLKGTKKRNIKRMQKIFKESVMETLFYRTNYTAQRLRVIEPYLDECVELCLLMNIQEPPLELRGLMYSFCMPFDESAFQPYTKSGKKIEYVVWPAMHLYRDGPLLCKGIAQGIPDPSDVHKPTSVKLNDCQAEHIRKRNCSHQSHKNITEKSKRQYYKPVISIATNVFCMEDNMPSSKTKPTHSVFREEKEVENSQTDSSESC